MLSHLLETLFNTGFIFFPLLLFGLLGWYHIFSATLLLQKERMLSQCNGEPLSFLASIIVFLDGGESKTETDNLLKTSIFASLKDYPKKGVAIFDGKPVFSLQARLQVELNANKILKENFVGKTQGKTNARFAQEFDDYCQQFAVEHLSAVKKGLATVRILAGVAPLLGLLGTVSGMIDTFEIISVYGNANPTLLADGISKALLTTQFGLAVALPLLLSSMSAGSKLRRLDRQLQRGFRTIDL